VITIAIPTGNLFQESLERLRAAGIVNVAAEEIGRRLVLRSDGATLITVRPLDVVSYVDHGSADLGIVGKDVLWETELTHYELLDLGFGRTRLVMAVPEGSKLLRRDSWPPRLRVATKYLAAARRFFDGEGQEVELIKLYGSVELAPLVGLADAVVDLSETGRTLRENNLREVAELGLSTARLIANQVSLRTRSEEVQQAVALIRAGAGGTAKQAGPPVAPAAPPPIWLDPGRPGAS